MLCLLGAWAVLAAQPGTSSADDGVEYGPADPGEGGDDFTAAARGVDGRDPEDLDEEALMRVLHGAGMSLPPGVKSKLLTKFPVKVYKGRWRWPTQEGRISSEYGPRWGKEHRGIDVAAAPGVPVYAAAAGEVLYADNGLRGWGNVVLIQHDLKTMTVYAHNTEMFAKKGQKVKPGEKIATVGSTGISTGPHLHFEIRGSKGPVDPRRILPKNKRPLAAGMGRNGVGK